MDRKKFLILLTCTVIAAFLGAFFASFLALGGPRAPHRPLPPAFMGEPQKPPMPGEFENAMEKQENILDRDMEFFDRFDSDMEDLIEHSPNAAGFIQMNNIGLKTMETPKEYKIEIDLKPFGGNAKNVDVKVRGNIIKISAGYKSKDKNNYSSSQFYQAMTLPAKIDSSAVKQEKQDDLLIITIPKK